MPDVVLPVLDEAEAIPWVLDRMPNGYWPVVVDNGSTDGSAEIATRLGALVVREERRGFGAACWAGLRASRDGVVCFMGCDGSLDPRYLPSVVGPRLSGEADLVIGARTSRRGAWPIHARIANRNWPRPPTCPMRAWRASSGAPLPQASLRAFSRMGGSDVTSCTSTTWLGPTCLP